jgi:hypothetical protein
VPSLGVGHGAGARPRPSNAACTVVGRGENGGATHRYGRVLLATVIVVVATIALPDDRFGRGSSLVLQSLLLALVTIAARDATGRLITGIALSAGVLGAISAFGAAVPEALILGLSGALAAAMIWVMASGVVALVRGEGVTPQAVAGGLTMYLLLGLAFSDVVGAISTAPGAFFAQGTDGTSGERVYYSFTTMTTTGFGDFTARTDVGRSIAVLEMLVGQIYLVVVVALLVGNLRRRDA